MGWDGIEGGGGGGGGDGFTVVTKICKLCRRGSNTIKQLAMAAVNNTGT